MEKKKVCESICKNARTLAARVNGEANQKIRILENICKKSDNYTVIEDCVHRIARLKAAKADINEYTPETVSEIWKIEYLIRTSKSIDEIC